MSRKKRNVLEKETKCSREEKKHWNPSKRRSQHSDSGNAKPRDEYVDFVRVCARVTTKAMMKKTEPFPIHPNNNRVRRLRIEISSRWVFMWRDGKRLLWCCCDCSFVCLNSEKKPFDDSTVCLCSKSVATQSLHHYYYCCKQLSRQRRAALLSIGRSPTNSHPILIRAR